MKKINSLIACLALTLTASTFTIAQSIVADHSGFNTFVGNYPVASAPKSFKVWGDNLTDKIQVTAPANFQISFHKDSAFKTTLYCNQTAGTVAPKKVYVRYVPGVPGTVATGDIVCSSAGATSFLINIAGVAKNAYINLAPLPFAPFSTVVGTPSSEQYYNLYAAGIASDLVITAPTGFEIAFNGTPYQHTLTLTPAYGKIATTAIWVRMKGTATGHFSGKVKNVASNISKNVSVEGDVNAARINNSIETADIAGLINYPNPVITTTTISFNLATATDVKVALYDLKGSEIKVLANSQMQSGVHTFTLDATELQTGNYLCKVQTGKTIRTLKIVKE